MCITCHDLTSTLPDTHFRVPQRTLRALLESYLQEQCSGPMRLRYPSGMDPVSTFLDDTQTRLYGCLNQRMVFSFADLLCAWLEASGMYAWSLEQGNLLITLADGLYLASYLVLGWGFLYMWLF